jgi:xylulokinase
LKKLSDNNYGAALGAARLGRLAEGRATVEEVCISPRTDDRVEPDDEMSGRLQPRFQIFKELYLSLRNASMLMRRHQS